MGQSELLILLIRKLESLGLSYLVTGSMATIAYGDPRLTNDIDIVIYLHPNDIHRFCDLFPLPEFYVSLEAAMVAVHGRRQFNIIHPASGMKIDVIIPKEEPFELSRQQRGIRLPIQKDIEVVFASPEDVILRKLQYFKEGGSEKHLRDIAGVLKVQGNRIDKEYITLWANRLAVNELWKMILNQLRKV